MTLDQERELNEAAERLFAKYRDNSLHGFGLRLKAVQFEFSPVSPHETGPVIHRVNHHFNKGQAA